jgi:DNA invertase Pin-like site-specific DNA recombinase
MTTTAYLRVSTGSQDLANQKLAILEYARQKKFSIDDFVEMQVSSRKSPHQRGIGSMLDQLAPGDRLIVSELSRLGRSLGQVIHIVDELVKRKIRFTAIKEFLPSSPVSLPCRMIKMRSANANTSGRSLEMTKMAIPSRTSSSNKV